MANQKGVAMLFIIMMVSFIAVIAIAGYFLMSQYLDQTNQLQSQQINQKSDQFKVSQVASWNEMVNNEAGFSLKYPNNFFDAGHQPKILFGDCIGDVLVDNCPNITNVIDKDQDVKVNYQNHNLLSAKKIIINNNQYCLDNIQEASMGHIYNYYYYFVAKNQKCLVVYFATSQTSCENYLPLEAGDVEQIQNYNDCVAKNKNQPDVLNQIISTFNFAQ